MSIRIRIRIRIHIHTQIRIHIHILVFTTVLTETKKCQRDETKYVGKIGLKKELLKKMTSGQYS